MTRFAPLAMCFVLACWTSSAPPTQPTPPTPTPIADTGEIELKPAYGPYSIEVLGLDVVGSINTTWTRWAHELTQALRDAVREHERIKLGPATQSLINVKVAMNCGNAHPSCMAPVAGYMKVDRLVYGEITGQSVTLELLVAATQQVVKWTSPSFDFSSSDTIRAGAREAMASLLSRSP